jgi:hypothetical protein
MMQSFKKKIVSLVNNGLEPLEIGIRNFKNIDIDVELLACDRAKKCTGCEMFTDEPIDFLRVVDKNIPELSNKMCDECGCTLSYKLRQSKNKCDKWLE